MRAVCGLVLALLVASCGASATATDGPPEINYGRDICIECGMIVDDPRFAAAYRLDDGTEKVFDDLGGLIIHGRTTGDLSTATVWVHDYETEEWLRAVSAFYVPVRGVASPMGHGILAFATTDRAARFAAELGGEVIDWDTVRQLPVVDDLLGHHHDEHVMQAEASLETEGHDHDG